MADQADSKKTEHPKSPHAEREESILAFWKEQGIFEKSLNKPAPKGEFVFYEGPPGANGRPHIGHFESRAFKDAIPRYKTMRGYRVRRRGGWDTHGLPVELQAEKELGIRSKKEIDAYGIEEFNSKCKEIVWTYVREWEELTERMAFWVDLKNAYVTYKPNFIESVWNIVKHVDHEKLLYKDYKVVPWCPRCGTALSSHELAQGYETVKDLSVYVKLKVKSQKSKVESEKPGDTYLLAWTTTPWTLPGNVGLAVNEKIEYVKIKDLFIGEPVKEELNGLTPNVSETMSQFYILAKDRFESVRGHFKNPSIVETFKGKDLIGTEYEPLYPFLKDNVSGAEKEKLTNAFKVYAGDFVTTEDGTGIVHMAPMYGQDDFELGTRVGLPKYHLVNDDGTFKKEAGFLAGKFVKDDEAVAVEIIKDLAYRGLLFYKEKYEHTYPFCWRCHTPLIYFARDSWYIAMSKLRDKLVRENEGIHWEPEHIKEGRFGEWLREVKDWAISRERYWGTPLPVWLCEKCGVRRVVGSVEEIARKPKNEYWIMRHGEAEFNAKGLLNSDANVSNHLTEVGKQKIAEHLAPLKGEGIDLIFASPFMRTQESARIVQKMFGLADEQFITDDRLQEMALGKWNGKPLEGFMKEFPMDIYRFSKSPVGVETYAEVKKRMGDFLYDIESKYSGKKILIVSHGSPTMMLIAAAHGWDREQTIAYELNNYIQKGHYKKVDFRIVPHNPEYELDLHRPYIDDTKLACSCGGDMKRVKEVMDVWFDSGAMPFAQDHYPFESKVENQESHGLLSKIFGHEQKLAYPADFISEAIDQTRGWFYTLHAVGTLMGMGKAYKNVICLGHILDADGKKMSKSLGNVV
ncbi:MAG: class I tRNA ligase family protein, partial [Patescibacteria group bacterium]|nr:class I tRNA ligase family protein [Patescibacteria group bacterium]